MLAVLYNFVTCAYCLAGGGQMLIKLYCFIHYSHCWTEHLKSFPKMADLKLFPKMAGLTSCPKVYLSLPRYNPPCQVSTHDFGQIRHDRQSLEQCFRHESDLWVGQIFSTLGNLVSVNDKFRRISEMSPDGVLTRIDFIFVKKKMLQSAKAGIRIFDKKRSCFGLPEVSLSEPPSRPPLTLPRTHPHLAPQHKRKPN